MPPPTAMRSWLQYGEIRMVVSARHNNASRGILSRSNAVDSQQSATQLLARYFSVMSMWRSVFRPDLFAGRVAVGERPFACCEYKPLCERFLPWGNHDCLFSISVGAQ